MAEQTDLLPDPFEKLTPVERTVAELIWTCQGSRQQITRLELEQRTGFGERTIKAIVARLRDKGIPIGSNRGRAHGYYRICTLDDAGALKPMMNQALAMIRTARASLPPSSFAELAGQIRLALGAEDAL